MHLCLQRRLLSKLQNSARCMALPFLCHAGDWVVTPQAFSRAFSYVSTYYCSAICATYLSLHPLCYATYGLQHCRFNLHAVTLAGNRSKVKAMQPTRSTYKKYFLLFLCFQCHVLQTSWRPWQHYLLRTHGCQLCTGCWCTIRLANMSQGSNSLHTPSLECPQLHSFFTWQERCCSRAFCN